MRKILLATTAIVAMGVTAAHADISISGGTVVTDTGLTVTVTQNNSLQKVASQVEDAFMEISGDFGKVILGQTDMVNDRNDGVLGKNNDVFTLGAAPNNAGSKLGTDTSDSTNANLGFESPSINGLKVYAGAVPAGCRHDYCRSFNQCR